MTTAPKLDEFETPVEATMDLPPLAILRVGDKADIVLSEVNIVKDEDDEDRYYFRATLLSDLTCDSKAKGEKDYAEKTFKKGETISLPGSGGLIYTLSRIANKKNGVALNEKKVNWNGLYGDRFIISRNEDEEMSKGRHKGKPVKAFAVQHAARKK